MKTNFDKTLTDHSAENRTWIMGLTFASIVMVIGLVILPFLDEMTEDKQSTNQEPSRPRQFDRITIAPLPEEIPDLSRIEPVQDPTPTTFVVPNASRVYDNTALADIPSPTTLEQNPPGVGSDQPPETLAPLDATFFTPNTDSPLSKPIIPAPESTENTSLLAELQSVSPPLETTPTEEPALFSELETIAPLPENKSLAEPFLADNPSPIPAPPETSSGPSPVFKIVSEEEIAKLENPKESEDELVSNLMKEIRSPRPNPEDSTYNNSLIQKFRKKNPDDPASNKELTEAMGDYYKQEGTFQQYADKFPDWATQYHEIKKTSTGPVLFRP
jgi:hypothetical protein